MSSLEGGISQSTRGGGNDVSQWEGRRWEKNEDGWRRRATEATVVLEPVTGFSEGLGNGAAGQVVEGQVDHMVKGMDGNAGWFSGG